ncbi:Protein csh3 [Malassezia brasiliensis]|uniref:Protein csh3 n=1 Tax=Malassezia brasiliensis TaxID=1821822 RepID=A0AAF0DWJ0_9BASI|nr:Protein csh3 [Malassezia brasiliensis]
MGFRTGFVIASISFVYGVLFITSRFDFPLLFEGHVTEQAFRRAEEFYLSMYNAPMTIATFFHAVIGLGLIGILAKMHRWTENDRYFGLGSVALYFGSIVMYLIVTLPNMRALQNPAEEYYIIRGVFEKASHRSENDAAMPLTNRERVSLVQVIAATNVIIAALLFGVLLFQGGEWYAIRQDRKLEEQVRKEQIAKLEAQRVDKKDKKRK